MSTNNSILAQAASNLLLVQLAAKAGWNPNARITNGGEILANHFGGDNKAFKGTENILPAPHNAEYLALSKAHNAVRSHFYEHTMPFGSSTDAKGKTSASGPRAITAKQLASGSFFTEHARLLAELDTARENFALAITGRVLDVQASGVLGSEFDAARYPSPDQIRAGWFYEPIVPEPITDGSRLSSMQLPRDMVEQIENQLDARVRAGVQFGQQSLVEETVKSVRSMADQLTKLSEWFSHQQGKRPRIFDSLVTNVQDGLDKLREYALPETDDGVRILALCDQIEARLALNTDTVETIKTSASEARRLARAASDIDDLVAGLDFTAPTVSNSNSASPTAQEPARASQEPTPVVETAANTSEFDDLLNELAELQS